MAHSTPSIPSTDDEVRALFAAGYPEMTGTALAGIYACRRGQGDDVTTAYQKTLETHVAVATMPTPALSREHDR